MLVVSVQMATLLQLANLVGFFGPITVLPIVVQDQPGGPQGTALRIRAGVGIRTDWLSNRSRLGPTLHTTPPI